ncbi:hypothetical protein [Natronosalvus rutilus]|uniref:Uncharacterized protein n=1 Tax=Natronosalvus rutilus TaxID=2953753 RepID=A0A9E7N741_9EURY|nr:hypothetical protein [Natronosalvus rutilus]UTF52725.1 hypothetical protein NGM29_13155 [Natronosalvus rutilus]
MGPVDLYAIVGGVGGEGESGSVHVYEQAVAVFTGLSALEQAAIQAVAIVLIGGVALGILRYSGTKTLEVSRRSPVISLCIGLPGALVLGGLFYTGILLSSSAVGIFFAIPLVAIGVIVLPVSAALGYVAIGATIATRVGLSRTAVWVIAGGLLGGVTALVPVLGIALVTIATALGVGAGTRVLVGNGGVRQPEERVVPPANKV